MSTFPEAKSNSEAKKLLVNLMLKVPIEIELELSQSLPTQYLQLSPQDVNYQIDDFDKISVIEKLNQSDSTEDVLISSSQLKKIVAQLIENNQILPSSSFTESKIQENHQVLSSLSLAESKIKENNSEKKSLENEQIEQFLPEQSNTSSHSITRFDKHSIARVIDLFNDGIVFTVNTVGTMLFLGKIANYSWEGET